MASSSSGAEISSSKTIGQICLACGELTIKKDRRVLGGSGSASEQVTNLWRETIANELRRRSKVLDFDSLIHPGAGYLCRKCYYSYEKLLETREVQSVLRQFSYVVKKFSFQVITSKMKAAIAVLENANVRE